MELVPITLCVLAATREVDKTPMLQVITAIQLRDGINPQETVPIFVDAAYAMICKRRLVCFRMEVQEIIAIITAQTIQRAHPDEAFAVLVYATNRIIGYPIVGRHVYRTHLHCPPQDLRETEQKNTKAPYLTVYAHTSAGCFFLRTNLEIFFQIIPILAP